MTNVKPVCGRETPSCINPPLTTVGGAATVALVSMYCTVEEYQLDLASSFFRLISREFHMKPVLNFLSQKSY